MKKSRAAAVIALTVALVSGASAASAAPAGGLLLPKVMPCCKQII